MKELFEIAGGSVTGRLHAHKSNQDFCSFVQHEDFAIGLVADGCSSGEHSEIGAKLATRLLLNQLSAQLSNLQGELSLFTASRILDEVRTQMLVKIGWLTASMGEGFSQTINDYFLFSLVGFVIRFDTTIVFSLGDGIFFLNGEQTKIGPFEGNAPPYLAYGLVKTNQDPNLLNFQVQRVIPTDEVQNLLIGTDGVSDLVDLAENEMPNNRNEKVGEIQQFWTFDPYFTNPDRIRRKLALINKEHSEVLWNQRRLVKHQGLLPDDTTLVVIRRK